ncbi:MAG: hypothetical protein HC846_06930 [Blastocatellia bacterium]|nr:hypothetical protein [Blastocatellia bacterium]
MNNSLKILLSEIVDYAGLFPPSQVSMPIAVQNFDNYLRSEHAWMLGRFIVPVSRLNEFSKVAKQFLDGENLWRLSVLAGEDLSETLRKVDKFNQANTDKAKIDTLEIKIETADEITRAAQFYPKI